MSRKLGAYQYELLTDLSARGLKLSPHLAVGDGVLGFWNALSRVYPDAKQQRCWLHKAMNVLNKLPKSLQSQAKTDLHDIWMSETKADADTAFDTFINKYQAKYPKATECLNKD